MPRSKIYANDAARVAAYRSRIKQRADSADELRERLDRANDYVARSLKARQDLIAGLEHNSVYALRGVITAAVEALKKE